MAFHPSGFHIVVALGDNKIGMYNILSAKLDEYHSFPFKNCREIRFSNGGHLFAAGTNTNTYIFNFYTLENPPNMQCKGHSGKINSIDWFEDDSGFCDGCNQGLVYFYDLQLQRIELRRDNTYDFKCKQVQINGVVNIPGQPYRSLVASNDRKIWDSKDDSNGCDARYSIAQL